jgi:hypothetical protein
VREERVRIGGDRAEVWNSGPDHTQECRMAATRNTQQQCATCNKARNTTRNKTHNTQHATKHATCNKTPNKTRNTQHATKHPTKHATRQTPKV